MEDHTPGAPPLNMLNRIRRFLDDVSVIARDALARVARCEGRLDLAGRKFNALRAEVESLALDVTELRRQVAHNGRDQMPWEADDEADASRRSKAGAA